MLKMRRKSEKKSGTGKRIKKRRKDGKRNVKNDSWGKEEKERLHIVTTLHRAVAMLQSCRYFGRYTFQHFSIQDPNLMLSCFINAAALIHISCHVHFQ